MRKLSAQDAMFLYNETPNTPMHVGGLQFLELADGDVDAFVERFRKMILDRLHLVEYLTSRVVPAPMNLDHPIWVRHADFDIDQHLKRVRLPEPGGNRELERMVAELYEPLLDRSKPLWEIIIIEGLESGQVGLLQKTHHACIDGASSVKAAELMFDMTAEPREVEPAPSDFWSQNAPGYSERLEFALKNLNRYWWDGVARIPAMTRAGWGIGQETMRNRNQERTPLLNRKTSLNASIDEKRSFWGVGMSLPTLKAVAKQSGVKLNDVMLAICGEGLNRYFARRGEAPSTLVASCPVSLHEAGDDSIANRVSAINISMANDVEDLAQRLQDIHENANAAKEVLSHTRDATPIDFGSPGMPAMAQAAANAMQGGWHADLAPSLPMHLVLSNVPGLPVPLYVAGARLISQLPLSIVVHGSALNLTVTSYVDRMDLGLTAASRVLGDVRELAADITAAYRDLVETILGEPPPPVEALNTPDASDEPEFAAA